jgi:Endonuclease NucS
VLFDLTTGALAPVARTTFAAEHVLERNHLQAAVRDHIDVLGEGLLVVSEEFGQFEDARRRIDLLCVDRRARLVVVELKRTDDGGHMELQALRYAAMVSVMTFDDLVSTYATHLAQTGCDDHDADTARTRLVDWFEDLDGDEPVLSREVGIVLAAADFSPEITTTVLWLNEFYSTDIRCVRLTPYRHEGRLLLDVQQVIPLPEAEELTVRLKKREAAARVSKESSRDLTKYQIRTPTGITEPLAKNRAVLALVSALHEAGVPASRLAEALPQRKFKSVAGTLQGDDLVDSFRITHQKSEDNLRRWFWEAPLHEDGRTWVVWGQWGTNTEPTLQALINRAPDGFAYIPH